MFWFDFSHKPVTVICSERPPEPVLTSLWSFSCKHFYSFIALDKQIRINTASLHAQPVLLLLSLFEQSNVFSSENQARGLHIFSLSLLPGDQTDV